MSKSSKFFLEEYEKSKVLGDNLVSTKSSEPPEFNPTAATNSQPIQGMFFNTDEKEKLESPLDVSKTPSPGGPIPIPYPNITDFSNGDSKSKTKVGGKSLDLGGSKIPKSQGDLPGNNSGIIKSTSQNIFGPIFTSPKVKMEGKPVLNHSGLNSSHSGAALGLTGAFNGMLGAGMEGLGAVGASAKKAIDPQLDMAKALGNGSTGDYFGAVDYALNMFKLQAKFDNIKIMAVSAIGKPGCLKGPNLESFIKHAPSVASSTGDEKKLRDAIAKGVGSNFEAWRSKVMVPGLPWYPPFAMFPGAQAPPMPNVPTPLISCVSSGSTKIMLSSNISASIKSHLPASLKTPQNIALIDALAIRLAVKFSIWLVKQQVMNVLGYGPVPTFAPPAVPAGPVVGGKVISIPGHLIA